ncbi:MAG: hypothetical protein LLF28_00200 [Nitrospiraceae bacterium]|nr:hypothetical protein [Nitrospiraceae bacterium]
MITRHFVSELKQLPFMLGKLIGGVMTVIGFTGGIFVITRKPDQSLSAIITFFAAGILGICIFILSSKLLEKQVNRDINSAPEQKDQTQVNIISWMTFSILIAIFLLITYIIIK